MTRKELKRLRIAAAIVLTAAIWAIWFPLVTSSNFRADSDRMLYHAEVALTQYVNEGRAGLVFLLRLLGLDHWHPVLSGVIFLICFAASGWLMGYYIYRFSGRQWNDANLLFVILFGTSPVWVFQAYFVLQIAGIGIGMLLLTLLAGLDVCVYTREKYGLAAKCACALLSSALLCFSITIYQALIVYYFTVIFLCLACHFRSGRGIKPSQAAIWLLQVLAAVAAYWIIQRLTRGGMSEYLMQQFEWKNASVLRCIRNIIEEVVRTMILYHANHASLYPLCAIMFLYMVFLAIRKRGTGTAPGAMELLSIAALLVLPYAMSVLYGTQANTRTQFALQISAAFIPVWFLSRTENGLLKKALVGICVIAVLCQSLIVVRLCYTDMQRNERDVRIGQDILSELEGMDTEAKPLVVLGALPFEDNTPLMEKTDVYGMSFFEWANFPDRPGSGTLAVIRLFEAMTDRTFPAYNYDHLHAAVEAAYAMPAYPQEGYVCELDDCIAVKLSE